MMKWHEVTISTKKENEDALTMYLNTIAKGVSIEYALDILRESVSDFDDKFRLDPNDYPESDITITVYFDETVAVEDKLLEIRAFIADEPLIEKENIKINNTIINEADWENEWKNHFHNFKVGKNFFIVPSWEFDDVNIKDEDKVIKIDPGMAFGTGDHATTSLCLTLMEDIIKDDDEIIDVGTGSGILSIGAYLLGAKRIKATDIDELSLQVSKENFELNDCSDIIEVESADLLTNEDGKYDVVVANILAHVIDLMIEDAQKTIKDSGHFIASGIITEKRDSIVEHMERVGFKIENVLEQDGWVAILAKKVK